MQPEIGPNLLCKVSCGCTAENVHSVCH